MCERNRILATMAHLTISDSIYLGWLNIVLISETPGSFGRGSGIACILQEDALKADSRALIKPRGRRYSALDLCNSSSAACAGFGGHSSRSE